MSDKPYVCTGSSHHKLNRFKQKCPYCQSPVIEAGEASWGEESAHDAVDIDKIEIHHASMTGARVRRLPSGVSEFDNILGGGFVPGEVVLFAGTPGAGKSSLLATVSEGVAETGSKVLYFSGEESAEQVSTRHRRLHAVSDNIDIVSSQKAEEAIAFVGSGRYGLVVVDSIQTMKSNSMSMLDIANNVCDAAHVSGSPVVIVGHFTKSAEVGGPMTLIHLVDAVFTLSAFGDNGLRILRADKNRFASTELSACFQHTDDGFREVRDPSGLLDSRDETELSGIGPTVLVEGTQPVLAEVQSLVIPTMGDAPSQFVVSGMSPQRVRIILASLNKEGWSTSGKDVFMSLGSGMTSKDAGMDAAIAASIISATSSHSISTTDAFIGEILLTGELRAAHGLTKRLESTHRMGLRAIGPHCDVDVRTVRALLELVLEV